MKRLTTFIANHLIATTITLLWIKTVLVTIIGFDFSLVSWLDPVLLIISPIGTLMLFIGFSFFLSKRVRPASLLSIYILITGLLYANLLYYRFYIDFVTVSVLLQISNLGGLGASTFELILPYDILIVADIFVIGYVLLFMKKRKMTINKPRRMKYAFASLSLIALTISLAVYQNPHLLKTSYDRDQLVKSLGIYNYQLENLLYGIKAPLETVLSDKKDA